MARRAGHAVSNLGYASVLLVGLAVLGSSFYYLSLEIIDSDTAWSLHEATVALCAAHPGLRAVLGDPVEGRADVGARGRGQSLNHHVVTDGKGGQVLVMRSYVQGSRGAGTVHVEMVKDKETGAWTHQLVQVDVPSTRQRILVVDKRPIILVNPPATEKKGWFGFGSRNGARHV
ncbi:Mitochondrial import inner membrane translocase subunit Tim21 [Thoreauomyces humboldtii]|nr:Mitochondrial import inner membrane translocase subunit Tim21 [Thoreauomyces humboldtii]